MPIYMLWPGIDGPVIRQQKKWMYISSVAVIKNEHFDVMPMPTDKDMRPQSKGLEPRSIREMYAGVPTDMRVTPQSMRELSIATSKDQHSLCNADPPSGSEIVVTRITDYTSSRLFQEHLAGAAKRVTIDFVSVDAPQLTHEAMPFVRISLEDAKISNYALVPRSKVYEFYYPRDTAFGDSFEKRKYKPRQAGDGTWREFQVRKETIECAPPLVSLTLNYANLIPETKCVVNPRAEGEVKMKTQLDHLKRRTN